MAISAKMTAFVQRSSWIRRMFEQGTQLKARYGAANVYDFSLGNPDLPPPPQFQEILQTLAADARPGRHAYMPNAGHPQVRAAVAAQISAEQGVALGREEVLMTCGAAGGLNVVLKALLNPGEEIILLAPYFVEYEFYVDNHQGISKIVPTTADFNLDLAAVAAAISAKTKAVVINSPNNPTGQIYPAKALADLGRLLEDAGRRFSTTVFLIADEPYRKIVFDNYAVPPVLPAYRHSIVVSSYSKDLSLPGERIGYVAIHPEIAEKKPLTAALHLANRILGFVNAPALMQYVVEKLQGLSVDCRIYERRRDLLGRILTAAGYQFLPPKGAFYIFPKAPISDDVAFVNMLLAQKILAVPGRGFGAPGYFRLAFCVEDQVIEQSAAAFKQALAVAGETGAPA